MTEQKQTPYPPGENPPAYPEAGQYGAPPPAGMPPGPGMQYQFGQPPLYPGVPAAPPGYMAGQPVVAQPMPGQQVIMIAQAGFRDVPVNTVCTHCGHHIITATHFEAGGLSWLLCFLLAIFGLWLGCCLIPFCVDGCQDVRHSCPNCKKTLYVFRRL